MSSTRITDNEIESILAAARSSGDDISQAMAYLALGSRGSAIDCASFVSPRFTKKMQTWTVAKARRACAEIRNAA